MKRLGGLVGLTLLPLMTGCDAYSLAAWNYTANAAAATISNVAWTVRDVLYYVF